jgi:hypothetical protein
MSSSSITPEPVFVNIYGAQESILPAYVAWWAGTTNRVVVPTRQAGNRFLGSLKGLQVWALDLGYKKTLHVVNIGRPKL